MNSIGRGGTNVVRKAVDLFSGAGGATAGMKLGGYKVLGAVEMNRDACATYRANQPEVHRVRCADRWCRRSQDWRNLDTANTTSAA